MDNKYFNEVPIYLTPEQVSQINNELRVLTADKQKTHEIPGFINSEETDYRFWTYVPRVVDEESLELYWMNAGDMNVIDYPKTNASYGNAVPWTNNYIAKIKLWAKTVDSRYANYAGYPTEGRKLITDEQANQLIENIMKSSGSYVENEWVYSLTAKSEETRQNTTLDIHDRRLDDPNETLIIKGNVTIGMTDNPDDRKKLTVLGETEIQDATGFGRVIDTYGELNPDEWGHQIPDEAFPKVYINRGEDRFNGEEWANGSYGEGLGTIETTKEIVSHTTINADRGITIEDGIGDETDYEIKKKFNSVTGETIFYHDIDEGEREHNTNGAALTINHDGFNVKGHSFIGDEIDKNKFFEQNGNFYSIDASNIEKQPIIYTDDIIDECWFCNSATNYEQDIQYKHWCMQKDGNIVLITDQWPGFLYRNEEVTRELIPTSEEPSPEDIIYVYYGADGNQYCFTHTAGEWTQHLIEDTTPQEDYGYYYTSNNKYYYYKNSISRIELNKEYINTIENPATFEKDGNNKFTGKFTALMATRINPKIKQIYQIKADYNWDSYDVGNKTRKQISHEGGSLQAEDYLYWDGIYFRKIESIPDNAYSEGYGSLTIGTRDMSEGDTIGRHSLEVGSNNDNRGSNSITVGNGNQIDEFSDNAVIEGDSNNNEGSSNSHIEGNNNNLIESSSTHIEGALNQGENLQYSHIEGYQNNIAGANGANLLGVHVEGLANIADKNYQHVQGKYAELPENNDYIDIVGNGADDDNRSNAYTLTEQGDGWYANTLTAEDKITAGNKIDPTAPHTPLYPKFESKGHSKFDQMVTIERDGGEEVSGIIVPLDEVSLLVKGKSQFDDILKIGTEKNGSTNGTFWSNFDNEAGSSDFVGLEVHGEIKNERIPEELYTSMVIDNETILNELADKFFVNSSIATATATYRGGVDFVDYGFEEIQQSDIPSGETPYECESLDDAPYPYLGDGKSGLSIYVHTTEDNKYYQKKADDFSDKNVAADWLNDNIPTVSIVVNQWGDLPETAEENEIAYISFDNKYGCFVENKWVKVSEEDIKVCDNNDYLFFQITDKKVQSDLPQEIVLFSDRESSEDSDSENDNNDYPITNIYYRFKFVETKHPITGAYMSGEWKFEYQVNNSGFTQKQWQAINSGISKTWMNDIKDNIKYIKDDIDDINTALNSKMDKVNPTGSGSLSVGRKNNTTVGGNSIAFGLSTTASGQASYAEGDSTASTSLASHAEGHNTLASAAAAHAEGWNSKATASVAHVEGNSSEANGANSHAEGNSSKANGANSHAENGSINDGDYAHTEGISKIENFKDSPSEPTFISYYAHAEGEGEIYGSIAAHTEGSGIVGLRNSQHMPSDYAHAEGQDTVAFNYAAHAEGMMSEAIGAQAHSEGYMTIAQGSSSHSEGQYTKATGLGAHAEGLGKLNENNTISYCEASGKGSHAEGYETKASGEYSHAEGCGAQTGGYNGASGQASHSEGWCTDAIGRYSHSEGFDTSASADGSHAEGLYSEATGDGAHAEGNMAQTSSGSYKINLASGEAAHSEGGGTTASGDYSHSEGKVTISSGQCAHAEGDETKASGAGSHAEGYGTWASGERSHAEGDTAWALGAGSHAEGNQTIANNDYMHASGKFNYYNGKTNTLFVVGNGSDENNRSNAFLIDNDGNVFIKGKLYVEANSDSTNGVAIAKKDKYILNAGSATGSSFIPTTLENDTIPRDYPSLEDMEGYVQFEGIDQISKQQAHLRLNYLGTMPVTIGGETKTSVWFGNALGKVYTLNFEADLGERIWYFPEND